MIIIKTPIYVWLLLAYLIFIGIKSSKTRVISWKLLLLMPIIFFTWSCYSMLIRYGISPLVLTAWLGSIALGIWAGSLLMRRVSMRFDKEKNLIEIPGSWFTLLFAMTIFSIKYCLSVTYAIHPELIGNAALFALDLVPSSISGILISRLIDCRQKQRIASHVDLA